MSAESFFERWARRNAEAASEKHAAPVAPAAAPETAPVQQPPPPPPPTLDDAARLTTDSDFRPFVARGVDESIRRAAMKKLFADPRFNVMDGLDVYIDDYSKFEPLPAAMLAALNHAKGLLDPLAQLDTPVMRLVESIEEEGERMLAAATEQAGGAAAAAAADEAATAGAPDESDGPAGTDAPHIVAPPEAAAGNATQPEKEAPRDDDPVQDLQL